MDKHELFFPWNWIYEKKYGDLTMLVMHPRSSGCYNERRWATWDKCPRVFSSTGARYRCVLGPFYLFIFIIYFYYFYYLFLFLLLKFFLSSIAVAVDVNENSSEIAVMGRRKRSRWKQVETQKNVTSLPRGPHENFSERTVSAFPTRCPLCLFVSSRYLGFYGDTFVFV